MIYQMTAVYADSEIAYAEGYSISECREQITEELLNSIYSEEMDEITFYVIRN